MITGATRSGLCDMEKETPVNLLADHLSFGSCARTAQTSSHSQKSQGTKTASSTTCAFAE
jgi:hypothetical protein